MADYGEVCSISGLWGSRLQYLPALDLCMTALADKYLLDHVFQDSFSGWKGMEGGLAA
jgi:hypothetical protein